MYQGTKLWKDRDEARAVAKDIGYEYVCFNGSVYTVDDVDTGLTVEHLDARMVPPGAKLMERTHEGWEPR